MLVLLLWERCGFKSSISKRIRRTLNMTKLGGIRKYRKLTVFINLSEFIYFYKNICLNVIKKIIIYVFK